jgi:predicted lipoprotein with Yx(FWY)xxD motif
MKRLISLPIRPGLIGLLIVFSMIVAACGYSGAAQTPSSAVPATGRETVRVANHPEFGQILVSADGKTLYTNTVDTPEALKCTNIACTGFWPPYTVETQPVAGEELQGSLGTVTRPDGALQLTYNDQPLYTFYEDRQPGDASGDGFTDFGGTWHVVAVGSSSPASSANSTGAGAYQE